MSVTTKMKQIAHDVYWGEGNPNHPECPKCGERMNFLGGDQIPIGEAIWKCPSCSFQFSEADLRKYDVSIY